MTDWAPRAPEVLARDQDTAVARYLAHSLELAEARAKAQELSATSREQRLDLARRSGTAGLRDEQLAAGP